ncbi:hypothetical protein RUND412_000900 [Rhizina undulata]
MSSSAVVPTTPATQGDNGGNIAGDGGGTGGGGTSASRKMRLKVSYTFDENKSNCLARWPYPVTTPVLEVDKDTLVGAVELKTCVMSVITSSPELVADLGQDYSVYAFDYSEAGVPLVGCGMLSWVMAAGNTPNGETPRPRVMITGRICSNMFGFFSDDGVKETLEVKIRLTPVKSFTQAQFIRSVHTYNDLAKVIPGGFDPSSWTAYLTVNPSILAGTNASIRAVDRGTCTVPFREPEEKMLLPAPQSYQQQQWRDNGVTSSEETNQPPKKKPRSASRRTTKTNSALSAARRKPVPKLAPSTSMSPPATGIAVEGSNLPPIHQHQHNYYRPPQPHARITPAPLAIAATVGVSRLISTNDSVFTPPREILPSAANENSPPQTIDSTVMASSPPIQPETPEEGKLELSPAPTSPALPLCPMEFPNEIPEDVQRDLDTLFEELEPQPTDAELLFAVIKPEPVQPPETPELSQASLILSLPGTYADDSIVSAAPSPDPSHEMTKSKSLSKRKYARKPRGTLTSDGALSSEVGDEGRKAKRARTTSSVKPIDKATATAPSKARTAANVKERIEMKLLEAVKEGKMPNYCMNCGAIETPTWRKVLVKENGEGDNKPDKEILLCNPCGLWHTSHKTMRPQDLWDGKKDEVVPKKPRSKKRKPTANQPEANPAIPQSSAPIVVLDEDDEAQEPQPATTLGQHVATPRGDRSAKGSNPEWEAAADASKRAIQSSPIRKGSADSPIDLDSLDSESRSPRRLLFPKPKTAADFRVLKAINNVNRPEKKEEVVDHSDADQDREENSGKENLAPIGRNMQPSTGIEIKQPNTPTKKKASSLHPKTPISASPKFGNLGGPSPWNDPIFSTPQLSNVADALITPERRLCKSQVQRASLSPTLELAEKLLAGNSAKKSNGGSLAVSMMELGTSPTRLPGLSLQSNFAFELDDEFFQTDATMPSSPPVIFDLYEDPDIAASSALWSEFLPPSPGLNNVAYELDFTADNGVEGAGAAETKSQHGATNNGGLVVDFSAFIDEVTKNIVPMGEPAVASGSDEPKE